jgi:hypothetical protein
MASSRVKKVEVIVFKLILAVLFALLSGVLFGQLLPTVNLRGLILDSKIYSGSVGGVGLVLLVSGVAGGVGLALRAMWSLRTMRDDYNKSSVALNLAILHFATFIGLVLTGWYAWSLLSLVSK